MTDNTTTPLTATATVAEQQPQILTTAAAKTAVNAPSVRSLRVPCYCEENVWRLAYRQIHRRRDSDGNTTIDNSSGRLGTSSASSSWYVVFVSNPSGCVPMFQQLAAASDSGLNDKSRNQPVFWDYHVILVETRSTTNIINKNINNNQTTTKNNGSLSESQKQTIQDCDDNGKERDKKTATPAAIAATTFVWDMDSLLPCPCPIEEYLLTSFHNHANWPSKYSPYFRYVIREPRHLL
jgi:N-terminal glutamine amidase